MPPLLGLQVLRHYSNVEEDVTLCPSWCLTLRLQAHTFEPGQQHFIPAYILDAPQVSEPGALGLAVSPSRRAQHGANVRSPGTWSFSPSSWQLGVCLVGTGCCWGSLLLWKLGSCQ